MSVRFSTLICQKIDLMSQLYSLKIETGGGFRVNFNRANKRISGKDK